MAYRLRVYVDPSQGGEVSLDGVNYQASIESTATQRPQRTVYARANPGYEFAHFVQAGSQVWIPDNPYTFWQNLYDDVYTAVFQRIDPYTITTAVSPANGGTTTGGGTYSSGASCTITATPASGYSFVRWEKNGAQVSTSASYTFTVSESATYTAIFEQAAPVTYTITTAVTPSGSGTATGGGTFNSGASCTLTATPANGYSFVRWEKNGIQVSTSSSYTFTVSESATYTAIFESATPLVHIVVTTFKSAGRVTLNGVPGDDIPSAWTTASADIPVGDPVTITATSIDPNVQPFKAWYLNPSAWSNPEQTGTLVSGAGATYTFTASASATYFATFNYPTTIELRTEFEDHGSDEAPDAVVRINGRSSGGNKFTLAVAPGSSVAINTTVYGGEIIDPSLGRVRLYFAGWIERYADPSSSTIISTDRPYTFLATQPYKYEFVASYRKYAKLTTAIMPNAAIGSISTSPTAKDGSWYEVWTNVTLTAVPSTGYRFVKWTKWRQYAPSGVEWELDITTNNQFTIEVDSAFSDWTYRAYFEWDGTDLLVNSANLGSPVQLVYDPATNKLVADY